MSLATIIAVTVDVTREHLANGRPGNCCRCALALAVVDAIEGAEAARVYYVSRDDIRADVTLAGGGSLSLAFPPEVVPIMAAIDARRPVAPFSFTAEVLTEREVA
jgi:hypothetical protein